MSFTTLQVTSAYSLLRSTIAIKPYVQIGRERGYTQLALTDEGVLHGALEFYEECQQAGVKPIIGCQFLYHPWNLEDKTATMVVYAADREGYQTLMALSSYYQQDKSLSQRMRTLIRESGAHVQVVFSQEGSEWAVASSEAEVSEWIARVREAYPETPIAIGVERTSELKVSLETLAASCGESIFLVPYVKAYYLQSDEHFSWDVLSAIRTGTVVDVKQSHLSGVYYLHEAGQLALRFGSYLDGRLVKDLDRFTASLAVEIPLHQTLLPKFATPEGMPADVYLRQLCMAALDRLESDERYHERLAYELSVIHQMGFDDYFLIVWDIMRYAREAGIQTGPGRGSAAGSLVAYLLGITQVDPIRYELLFERFLNPERQSMPDIDLDFPDNRREMLLAYVAEKYNTDHVAQIATFGTLAAKQAIRDVCRALGQPASRASQWSRILPNRPNLKLTDAYQESKTFRDLVNESNTNLFIFDTARKIEGLPRHMSTHAAGVVISDAPLITHIPLVYRDDVLPTTQYTMTYVEKIGLLKMDFLGLTNLAILHDAIENTKKVYHEDIDITTIPLDDADTLALFQQADTNGIFQFESDGIRRVLKKVRPTSLDDITAVNALYRPGPMEQIDTFVKRKHGQEPITYPHPVLEGILKSTYGVMVYQEQVMQVANQMAGYSLGEADILRRAISKKKLSVIEAERRHFVEGAGHKGIAPAVATQVYDYIERFANYGFNKSHALAYSLLAYQLAYLKAHYPIAFYTGLFNAFSDRTVKRHAAFTEAKAAGITIHAPNINTSVASYLGQEDGIYIGLGGIKGLRRDFIQAIVTERYANGPFEDFMDFAFRLGAKFAKAEPLVALIDAGAFDVFGFNRATLRATVPAVVESVKFHQGMVPMILVDDLYPKYFTRDEDDVMVLVDRELDVLGFPMTAFPTDQYEKLYEKNIAQPIGNIYEATYTTLVGMIRDIKRIRTKKGRAMARAVLQDATGTIDIVIFPDVYPRVMKQLNDHTVVGARGTIVKNPMSNKDWQLQVEDLYSQGRLDTIKEQASTRIFLKIPRGMETEETFRAILRIARRYPGNSDVYWYLEGRGQLVRANFQSRISLSEDAIGPLQDLLGYDNVKKSK